MYENQIVNSRICKSSMKGSWAFIFLSDFLRKIFFNFGEGRNCRVFEACSKIFSHVTMVCGFVTAALPIAFILQIVDFVAEIAAVRVNN
jgi:hypothetical protein